MATTKKLVSKWKISSSSTSNRRFVSNMFWRTSFYNNNNNTLASNNTKLLRWSMFLNVHYTYRSYRWLVKLYCCLFALQISGSTSCDVLEYRNLTMRPVFTDWWMTSHVSWHLPNQVKLSSLVKPLDMVTVSNRHNIHNDPLLLYIAYCRDCLSIW